MPEPEPVNLPPPFKPETEPTPEPVNLPPQKNEAPKLKNCSDDPYETGCSDENCEA